ncbi:MAG TPA: outer membrane lipoprotein-sorting protein [Polyangiales bacterium]
MWHLVTLRLGLGLLVLGLCGALAGRASAGDLSADQIVEKMLKQGLFGLDEAETTVRMGLIDSAGARTERVMENLRRRKDGQLQSVTRFRAPAEVAGTAFLMLERDKGESEQHIYLPGLKRTRRIVGREREGSFMGSDFTYADMERRDTRHADHKRLPDEDVGGVKTYVLESTPKKEAGSTYSKIETWVRQDNFLPLRIRFYDKAGKLLKTLYTKRIKTIDGQPVIVETQMVNKQTGHTTELVVDSLRARKDVPDAAFTPTALEHG